MKKYKRNKKLEEPEKLPKSKKNTRLWCKGKPGVKHVTKWVKHHNGFMTVLECEKCKKGLDYCFPRFSWNKCKCGMHSGQTSGQKK